VADGRWPECWPLDLRLHQLHCRQPASRGRRRPRPIFPSQSISLRSPAFGFTETASTGRTTDYSAMFTFGVPIGSFR
jgi:hypothetical protein